MLGYKHTLTEPHAVRLARLTTELDADRKPLGEYADVRLIRTALEYAPAVGGPIAADLLGWWTPEGFFVCSKCVSRIIARGCSVPNGSEPVWHGQPYGVCIGHESDSGC